MRFREMKCLNAGVCENVVVCVRDRDGRPARICSYREADEMSNSEKSNHALFVVLQVLAVVLLLIGLLAVQSYKQ
jgi:hypothetical protein